MRARAKKTERKRRSSLCFSLCFVIPQGLEPWTLSLKGRCSTN